jgi:hypothetical protein
MTGNDNRREKLNERLADLVFFGPTAGFLVFENFLALAQARRAFDFGF